MEIHWLIIIFYLLLLDSIGANIAAWSISKKWWHKHMGVVARLFPLSRGWTTYYFVLVLFIGYLLAQLGVISWLSL